MVLTFHIFFSFHFSSLFITNRGKSYLLRFFFILFFLHVRSLLILELIWELLYFVSYQLVVFQPFIENFGSEYLVF